MASPSSTHSSNPQATARQATVTRHRRQQHIEALCAATLRALGSDATVHFRGHRLWHGAHPLPLYAPHLRLADDDSSLANHRALADGVALRLRHSDPLMHQRLSPASPPARLIFELLEQLRVEALAPASLPGVTHNLERRFHRWSEAFVTSGLSDTSQGILLYSLAQIVRSRLTARALPELVEIRIEHTRAALAPVIGTDLAALRRHRQDQAAYAEAARRIADHIGAALEEAIQNQPPSTSNDDNEPQQRFALLLDFDHEVDDGISSLTLEDGRTLEHEDAYRVFTRAYDDEKPITALIRPAQLKIFRAALDRRIADQGFAVRRVARRFAVHFAHNDRQGWSFNEESGYLDGRRLSALVTSPHERHLFRREAEPPRQDGIVSFLIDCSGSMRTHGEAVAILVDRLCTALDLAGVDSEILGFTTAAWHGGRALKDWRRSPLSPGNNTPPAPSTVAGTLPGNTTLPAPSTARSALPSSPAPSPGTPPGRLNERRHLIIKSAEQPWRRARHALAGLLKADIYKEGLDGEALDWASQRLLQLDRQRRVLVVFSDGSPMDTATHQHNGPGYLDEHLRRVRERHDRHGRIALRAVGVGLDLSPFYPHNLPINLTDSLDNQLLDDIAALITRPVRR